MKTFIRDPSPVYLSSLIYRLLLITYPKDFRRAYATSMAQVFRDCCLRAFYSHGIPGMISLWSLALADYIKSMFAVYARRGLLKNSFPLFCLSGLALIVGSVSFLTSGLVEVFISGRLISSDPNNFYSRPIDQFLAILPYILMPCAMLLLTIGVIGLCKLYRPRSSTLGTMGLIAAVVGGGLAFVTCCIAEVVDGLTIFLVSNRIGGGWLYNLAALGLFLLFAGIFIFGIDAIKRQLLSSWNYILILAGVMVPVRILLGYLQEATTVGFSRWRVDVSLINLPMLIITAFGLIILGTLLIYDAPREEQLVIGKPGVIG